MRGLISLLIVVGCIAVFIQQVSASTIMVRDSNGYSSPNANVQVMLNGQQVCSGNTNNFGSFDCDMNPNFIYQVFANGYGQSGSWQGHPGPEIDINMH